MSEEKKEEESGLFDKIFVFNIPDFPRGIYNIASVVRGPDFDEYEVLKWIFTARIRYWLFGKEMWGISMREEPLSKHDFVNLVCALHNLKSKGVPWYNLNHYLTHVEDALNTLRGMFGDPSRKAEIKNLISLSIEIRHIYEEMDVNKTNLETLWEDLIQEYSTLIKE